MQPSDFLRPTGRIDPTLMGGDDAATTTLNALILASESITSDEDAQVCWVYWRAYQQLADDVMRLPAAQRDRNKSVTFSAEQLQHFASTAREYERCYWRHVVGDTGYQPGTTIQKEVTPSW